MTQACYGKERKSDDGFGGSVHIDRVNNYSKMIKSLVMGGLLTATYGAKATPVIVVVFAVA
jgi:hypothetical protein